MFSCTTASNRPQQHAAQTLAQATPPTPKQSPPQVGSQNFIDKVVRTGCPEPVRQPVGAGRRLQRGTHSICTTRGDDVAGFRWSRQTQASPSHSPCTVARKRHLHTHMPIANFQPTCGTRAQEFPPVCAPEGEVPQWAFLYRRHLCCRRPTTQPRCMG